MLEEPHAGTGIWQHVGDLLGTIDGDGLFRGRRMESHRLGTTGSPHPQCRGYPEAIQVTRATGDRRLLHARAETLAVEKHAGSALTACKLRRNTFEEERLRPRC